MEPSFSGSKAEISYRRTIPNLFSLTDNWKVTVECGMCGTVYKDATKGREGEIKCKGCRSPINYKLEIP